MTEPEDLSEEQENKESKSDKQRLEEFKQLVEEGKAGTMQGKLFISAVSLNISSSIFMLQGIL